METRIREAIAQALLKRGAEHVPFAVEWPTETVHGDYATNAALAAAKQLGMNPRTLADELVPELLESLGDVVRGIEVAGPGFINLFLSRDAITGGIEDARAQGTQWGRGTATEGQRVIVEYSCPNPFKEMHIGHLMSTVIGEAVSRLIEAGGAAVIRDSYGGDVGPHIAKAIWALRQKGITEPTSAEEVGVAYAEGARAYEDDEDAKAEIDVLNQALYAATDTELMETWRKGRDVSLQSFQDIYRLFGTHFDYFFFESETAPIGMEVVKDGLAKGIFEESEGAIVYKGEKKGLHTLVFITSRGTPTYETKDIGLAFLKEERVRSDRSYILTAAEQIGHFKVFLAALEDIAPLVAQKTKHIPHGFLRLTTGKMASRTGNVITARELFDEVLVKAQEKNDDPLIAEQVAVAALKYMILRQAPGGDIIFDPEKSLSLEGDSGPYLQYALVRARSILAEAAKTGLATSVADAPSESYLLERLILRFPRVIERAEAELAPQHVAQYLTQLASEWNSFYAKERILGGEHQAYKLAVVEAFKTTMENGLSLLGMPAPERM
jgi:arginyl-tRNA synthetase